MLRELKQRQTDERERRQHVEIDRLEEHLDQARVRLADMKPAADAAWAELRQAIETLLANVRKLLEEHKRGE